MQEFCCFIVFLCQCIHYFVFPEIAGRGGATAPLATPLDPPLVTNKLSPITSQYKLYNHLLAHVSEAKYLGLTLDKHLNFNKHIDVTCKKANASLAFIRRNTYFCNRNVKIDAYKTCVLPIMEYAAFVWSPHTSQNINKLETIQRRAAHFVMSNYDRHSSVSEMLHVLQWSRLQERRNVQSLLIFYKILNGLVDVSLPDGVTPAEL